MCHFTGIVPRKSDFPLVYLLTRATHRAFLLLSLSAQERQRQLESMGISLETSGIKVGDDKCYLVNLNADPALNELLVYYLKVRRYISR